MRREHRLMALLAVLALVCVVPLAKGLALAAERCRHCRATGSCPRCQGGTNRAVCGHCNGLGTERTMILLTGNYVTVNCMGCNGQRTVACPECGRSGRCRDCLGSGEVTSANSQPSGPSAASSASPSASASSASPSSNRSAAIALAVAALKLEANGVTAEITKVTSQHGVIRNRRTGMLVVIDFEVINAKGVNGQVDVRFESLQGTPLSDFDGDFANSEGEVVTSNTFRPAFDHAKWKRATLFIPYEQLHLDSGRHQLRCVAQVSLFVDDLQVPLATSVPHQFSAWRN